MGYDHASGRHLPGDGVASDELANPPNRVTRHSLESGAVLIDNTPPVFSKALAMNGRVLTGEVTDH